MLVADYDLGYLQTGLAEIEPYLLSGELFWPLGTYPRLTIGGLLFALARCRVQDLSPSKQSRLQKCQSLLDSTRTRWQTAWRKKSEREFVSRLKQWQHYINDLTQNPDKHIPYYQTDVRARSFISLLSRDRGFDGR